MHWRHAPVSCDCDLHTHSYCIDVFKNSCSALALPCTVLVFRDATTQARAAEATVHWGDFQPRRRGLREVLGGFVHDSCTWQEEIALVTTKGRGTLCVWLRTQHSPLLAACAKAVVLCSRTLPCVWSGVDVWHTRAPARKHPCRGHGASCP